MTGPSARFGATDPSEPIIHDLPPLKYEGGLVPVSIIIRRAEDGSWRGRLRFAVGADGEGPSTAEIFFAETEQDLWQCVYDLREHHLRDLFRSVSL